jgi:hypothetical protein
MSTLRAPGDDVRNKRPDGAELRLDFVGERFEGGGVLAFANKAVDGEGVGIFYGVVADDHVGLLRGTIR